MDNGLVEPNIFVTAKGVALVIRPVSQFKIDTLRTSKQEVPVPTYETETATGEKLVFALDAESAESRGRVDEWKEYLAAVKKNDAEYSKKFTELMFWEGIGIDVPGPDSEWQQNNDYFGIATPTNPIERKAFYLYSEALVGPDEIGDLIADIFQASQVDEEAVKKLRDSFRSRIQGKADKRLPEEPGSVEGEKSDV